MEREVRKFDSKRKSPVVIEISDDDRRKKGVKSVKKTLKAKLNKKAKKDKLPQTSDMDFTISLSPDLESLKRSKTILPVAASHHKLLDLQDTQLNKASGKQKAKDDSFGKKSILVGKKRRGKAIENVHHCSEKRYTATSKWNDIITDR